MDQFEGLIGVLLEAEGYWVRHSFKVNVTKSEKVAIGKPNIPRPEIDILAFKQSTNTLLAIEVKSFLDSPGLSLEQITAVHETTQGRYKLFTNENYRSIVLARLKNDLIACGMASDSTIISLGLAVGKVYQNKYEPIVEFMKSKEMFFWSPSAIKDKVVALADRGYENNVAIMVAKLLTRDRG